MPFTFNSYARAGAGAGVVLLAGSLLWGSAAPAPMVHARPAQQDHSSHSSHSGMVGATAALQEAQPLLPFPSSGEPVAAEAPVVATASVAAEIRFFYFAPDPLVVAPGTLVAWTNRDAIVHSVTAGSPDAIGAFDSGLFDEGQSFSLQFTEPGEYAYFCLRHPSMQGLLSVSG